jgi:exopolyphosphatase/guanosine-5'-triphosphate,3'-diphosphate pyrophosphatase
MPQPAVPAPQAPVPDPAETAAPFPANGNTYRRGPSRPAYGAIDLGTNNCRLLIARPSEEGFTVVDAFSRVVRMGEGTGSLASVFE